MGRKLRVLQKLITDECANYFKQQNGIANLCVEQDQPCRYFEDLEQLPRCKHLEECILTEEWHSAAQEMYLAVIVAQQEGDRLSKTKVRAIMERAEQKGKRKCSRCGTRFRAGNNRQQYCDICKKIVQRDQARARMRNLRKAGSSVTL